MQFLTASMSAMLAITKHGVFVGVIGPCLVNFIMADHFFLVRMSESPCSSDFLNASFVSTRKLSPTTFTSIFVQQIDQYTLIRHS